MIDIQKYKAVLEEKLNLITADLGSIGVYDATNDNWEAIPDPAELTEADINSEADATEDWNERRSTLASLETEYRDTKRALLKLEQGTYGTCEICNGQIEEPRLEAKPTARTCISHLEEEDKLTL